MRDTELCHAAMKRVRNNMQSCPGNKFRLRTSANGVILPAMGIKGQFFAAAITLAVATGASAQFWSVGRPDEPGSYSDVYGLSSDGSVGVGFVGRPTFNVGYGFTWSRTSGRYDFGTEPGVPAYSGAFGVSGDGRVVVGASRSTGPNAPLQRAYRWTGPGTFQSLGDPGRFTASYAVDANRDGSVIVGNLTNNRGTDLRPFRWTASGGLQSLGFAGPGQTTAYAISDDGNTIVGRESGTGRGWTWKPQTGYSFVQGLPGGQHSALYGTNRAGTIYVGTAFLAGQGDFGAMWINDTVINLGRLSSGWGFMARSVDDAGTIVSGDTYETGATVWTQARGTELLADYLFSQGITLPMGIQLATCSSMSSDGLTFAGTAYSNGDFATSFGYIVTIPAPASLGLAMMACVFSPRRRLPTRV